MKLSIKAIPSSGPDVYERNIRLCPDIPEPKGEGSLAIVGGGPSIRDHIEELHSYDDVWAINFTANWCASHGIDCWMFTADPGDRLAECAKGHKSILAHHCSPKAFEAATEARKCTGPFPGPSSAVSASVQGLKAGYDRITFYGCESSYPATENDSRYAYPREAVDYDDVEIVEVECGGRYFLTRLEFILQAQNLADVIRAFPDIYSENGGGFLSALVEHGDYDVTRVSRSIRDRL